MGLFDFLKQPDINQGVEEYKAATQLKELDLAYAPPYSSAKDPVNIAGYMIDNIAKGALKQWHLDDIEKLSKDGSATLLDVQTTEEYDQGYIEGFMNIPVDELRDRLDELEKGKPVYVICQSGLRSHIACRILEAMDLKPTISPAVSGFTMR